MYTKYIQVDRDLPHYIWGSVTIYNFNWLEVEQNVPLYNFLPLVHLATPLHLWHTLGGSRLLHSAYRYLCPKSKRIKQ